MTAEHARAHHGQRFAFPRLRPRYPAWPLGKPRTWSAVRTDLAATGLLVALSVILTLLMIVPVHSFIRGDWPTQFFPVYSYLGERLRAFDIPGWNPYQFSGAPFAGDPESGWMYLPAMVIYALLPAEAATAVYLGFHIAMAGVAVYVLARLLGLSVSGGLIGGASYAFAWVAPASMHLIIWFPVTVWLLVAWIAVELAVRAASWPNRLWGWLLAATAISQILAAWLGQASYYALLSIAAWIAYRTLIVPIGQVPVQTRIRDLALTGLAVFGCGFGVSAAGVLPRWDMVSRSNLSGGVYEVASSWEDAQTGFTPPELLYELVGGYSGSLWWHTGAIAVALAVMAPLVARRWRPMPFFLLVAVASLVVALPERTPIHAALYALLPRFEELHEHAPYRVLMLVGPAIALLAAATVTYLPRWDRSRVALGLTALVPAALAMAVTVGPAEAGVLLSPESTIMIAAASLLAAGFALPLTTRARQTALIGLFFLAVWDPAGRIVLYGFADATYLERSLTESLAQDPEPFLYANGGAAFIAAQAAATPARYAGYDPTLLPDPATIETKSPDIGYRGWNSLKNTGVNWLLVLNWGTWFGIDDVQGYNPIQLQRYAEYIDALNGHRQEYHERDVFPAGLSSPLLDLLNLRFLVVPRDAPSAPVLDGMPAVYEDEHVRILENPEALPRAWLVHEARQIAPGDALPLLVEGAVNPLDTALLESAVPPLEPAPGPERESAVYVRSEPDRIEIQVTAQAPALLVLSEIWDPGWHAAVAGQPAPVLVANHILRAIPVPAGQHLVILDYQPPMLRFGLVLTVATTGLLAGAAAWPWARRCIPGAGKSEEP